MVIAILVTAQLAHPQASGSTEAIRRAQVLNVTTLSPKMKSEGFTEWFMRVVQPDPGKVYWTDEVCGRIKGGSGASPVCVSVEGRRRERSATISATVSIQMGTVATGVNGAPRVFSVSVEVLPHGGRSMRNYDVLRGESLEDLAELVQKTANMPR